MANPMNAQGERPSPGRVEEVARKAIELEDESEVSCTADHVPPLSERQKQQEEMSLWTDVCSQCLPSCGTPSRISSPQTLPISTSCLRSSLVTRGIRLERRHVSEGSGRG